PRASAHIQNTCWVPDGGSIVALECVPQQIVLKVQPIDLLQVRGQHIRDANGALAPPDDDGGLDDSLRFPGLSTLQPRQPTHVTCSFGCDLCTTQAMRWRAREQAPIRCEARFPAPHPCEPAHVASAHACLPPA